MRDWLFRMKDKWGDSRYSSRNRAIAGVVAAICGGVLIFVDVNSDVAAILLFVIVIAAVLLLDPRRASRPRRRRHVPPRNRRRRPRSRPGT